MQKTGIPIFLNEEVCKSIFDNSGMAITIADREGRLVHWNACAENLLGVGYDQLYLKPVKELYPENEWRRIKFKNLRQKGSFSHFETKLVKANRDTADVELNISLLTGKDGTSHGSVGIMRDMSEQKKIARALQETEDNCSLLLKFFPLPLFFTDGQGEIEFVNDSFTRTFGYTINDIPTLDVWLQKTITDEKSRNEIISNWQRSRDLSRGKNKEFEQPLIQVACKDGTVRIAELYSTTIGAKDMSILNDITEHKKAEEALRASEARFRNLVENAPLGISITTADGRFLGTNRAMAEMFGYDSVEEFIKIPVTARYWDPEDRKQFLELFSREGKVQNFELQMRHRDGSRLWCSICAIIQPSESGQNQFISILEDITGRREMEEALHKSKETAEAATRAKSEFLAHMSHEIRTPMNAIVGLSHLALKTKLTPKQNDYLNKIQSSASSLMGIINDILDLSKVEAGKLEIEKTSFKLNQVLDNVANMFSSRAQEKGLRMLFRTDPGLPKTLVGDPLRLGQIMINLVSNALKFTASGEIVISSELLSSTADEVTLKFTVRDTGIGIAEEQKARLFQPFTQSDSSITRRFGGTGLGLAICKRLVAMMGGEITVDSAPAAGSTFTFTVILGLPPDETRNRKKIVPVALRGLKVLVADDNCDAREVMQHMLTDMKFNVKVVDSGQAVLKELKDEDHPCDLVLLDWRMPDMDGFETARRIRSRLRLSRPPKIFIVTAYGREEAMHQAKELGLNGFLVKPVSYSVLLDSVIEAFYPETERTGVKDPRPAGKSALAGARVLVAEDNEINQQVARELLEGLGLAVEIAASGREAIKKIAASGSCFDGVLMDLQMPEMDGYEATRIIREKVTKEDLPVIAMTAHALQSDIQRCLDIGMNDYVLKPVDPEDLISVLLRWLKPHSHLDEPTDRSDTATRAVIPSQMTGQFPGIDAQAALRRLSGNRRLFNKLLRDFARDYVGVSEKIRDLLDSENPAAAQNLIHTLKGVAGNLAITEIFAIAQELELAIRENNGPRTEAALEKMRKNLNLLNEAVIQFALEKAFESPEAGNRHPLTPGEELGEIITDLDGLLKKNNLRARQQFDLLKEKTTGLHLEEFTAQLEGCLMRLDFKAARKHLAALGHILGIEVAL